MRIQSNVARAKNAHLLFILWINPIEYGFYYLLTPLPE
jgi:hypothetical protein